MTDTYVPDFGSNYDQPDVPPDLAAFMKARPRYAPLNARGADQPQPIDPNAPAARAFLKQSTDIGAQADSLSDPSAVQLAQQYGWTPPSSATTSTSGKGSILPFSYDENGIRLDLSAGLPGMMASGATLPGDVYSGKTPVMDPATGYPSEEVLKRTQALAGIMQPGGAFEAKVPGTVLGSGYVGKLNSGVDKAVASFPQEVGTGAQWLALLRKQAKPEEIEWRKIDLDPNAKYTKAQVQEILADSKVQVGEKVLGDKDSPNVEDRVGGADNPYYTPAGQTKYSGYQLPGGENYREVLVTLPPRLSEQEVLSTARKRAEYYGDNWDNLTPEEQSRYIQETQSGLSKQGDNYRSSHWDEPNVLGHMRLNDRSIPLEGNASGSLQSLHSEEYQSDWHQTGRKQGYGDKRPHLTKNDITTEYKNNGPGGARAFNIYGPEGEELARFTVNSNFNEEAAIQSALRTIPAAKIGVPDAPFKKSWPDLLLKRHMQEAVDKGYDAISWTDGASQADRYDLSKQVDNIRARKNSDGSYVIDATPKGQKDYQSISNNVSEKDLPNLIGKELADKVVKDAQNGNPFVNYSGIDLKVGGEGMKAFYDTELPRRAQKLWGVKPEHVTLPEHDSSMYNDAIDFLRNRGWSAEQAGSLSDEELMNTAEGLGFKYDLDKTKIHVIRITPEIKARVQKGQPLFANKSPEAGAVALTSAAKQRATELPMEEVKAKLDALPTIPTDKNWLHPLHSKEYTDNLDEVATNQVANLATNSSHGQYRFDPNATTKYSNSELKWVPLDKVYYTQPSLNKGKLLWFAKNYHPDKTDFHPRDGELSQYEAPHATQYPDGTYVATDHHRLIASQLRGDTHAWIRVHTAKPSSTGLKFKKTKPEDPTIRASGAPLPIQPQTKDKDLPTATLPPDLEDRYPNQ